MRRVKKSALIGILGWGAAVSGHAADQSFADRIEMLDWSDPPRAAKMIEGPALGKMRDSDVQFLEVRGMVYADVRRDVDVEGTLARLKSLAEDGDQSATVAEQYAAASAELSHIDMKSISSDSEAYRVSILRGNTLSTLGQADAALPFLEEGLDLARDLHDEQRTLHALLW